MLLRRDVDQELNEHIDMTPMVDVVFQLMTFMLFSVQMTGGEKVDVPPARHGVGVEETAATFLTLTKPPVPGGETQLLLGHGEGPVATLEQARQAVADGAKAGSPESDSPGRWRRSAWRGRQGRRCGRPGRGNHGSCRRSRATRPLVGSRHELGRNVERRAFWRTGTSSTVIVWSSSAASPRRRFARLWRGVSYSTTTWFDQPEQPLPGPGWPTCPNCSSPPTQRPWPASRRRRRSRLAHRHRVRPREEATTSSFRRQRPARPRGLAPAPEATARGTDRIILPAEPSDVAFPVIRDEPTEHRTAPAGSKVPKGSSESAWRWDDDKDEEDLEEEDDDFVEPQGGAQVLGGDDLEILDAESDAALAGGFEIVDEGEEKSDSSSFALPVTMSGTLPVAGSAGPMEDPGALAEIPEEEEFSLSRSGPMTVEELDLAPMVDVAFQLVLFFMVAAQTGALQDPRDPQAEHGPGAGGRYAGTVANAR